MKLLVYFAILVGVWLIPVRGTDVGKLIPVEVIAVSENGGVYTVRTDTGDAGQGETVDEAFRDLKSTSPGIIYLDTAEYLLMEPGCRIGEIKPHLKDSVRVCAAGEGITLDGIADYLSVHKPDTRLKDAAKEEKLSVILEENGRYLLKEK